jgi:hypothetical protein
VARQPDLADALALLGYGRLMSGRPVEALDPLVKAHEISPRQEYALMAAQAYVANRDLPSARQVLAVLAERGETPGIRQEARELLDEVTSAEHPQPGEASARAAAMERASATNWASGAMGLVPVFRTVGDGETREAGILQEIACSRDAVVLVVALPGRVTRFGAPEFINIAFINYRTDMTGSVSCGRRARPEKVYLTWRDGGPAGTDGRAVAVEFLPPGINP